MKLTGMTDSISFQVNEDAAKPLAVIHLDLDGCKHIYHAHGWRWQGEDDLICATGLPRALNFFDQAGVRATLFVIAEDLNDSRKREMLRGAMRLGHEIASHSLTHRKLTSLRRDEKRREIFESRERLMRELGVDARGFRAPGFALDRESFELIDEAGYSYDSSLFPSAGFARRIGVDQLSAAPHRPAPDRPLVEFPMPAYGPLPFPFHPCYSLTLGMWYFRLGLRRFQRSRAPLTLLFHLTDFADPLPEERLPNLMARIYTLSNLDVRTKLQYCGQMLELVRRNYQLVDTSQLLASQRHERS
jgi:peptidoglycan-N-acetylglucosamine deacetylase